MPEIMRQFGQVIVVTVAGSMLIAMLFTLWPNGGSVLDDIGSRASSQLEERSTTGTGTAGFDEHSLRSLPRAAVNNSVPEDQEFVLLDRFTITSADGGVWDQTAGGFVLDGVNQGGRVQVESIVSSNGTEHVGGLTGDYRTPMVELSQETGIATFLDPGVYRIGLRVMDYDNVEARYTIPLIVDYAVND